LDFFTINYAQIFGLKKQFSIKMILKINILEAASTLAELKTIEEIDKLPCKEYQKQYPNGIYVQDENRDERFSDEAQDVFNDYYDHFMTILTNCQVPDNQLTTDMLDGGDFEGIFV